MANSNDYKYDYDAALAYSQEYGYSKGIYIQADAGLSGIGIDLNTYEYGTENFSNTNFTPRIALGYDFGTMRLDVDYTDYGKIEIYDDSDVHIKIKTIGVKFIKLFNNNSNFRPFVGGRLNYSTLKSNCNMIKDQLNNEHSLGLGGLGGIEYRLNNHFFIGAGMEINYLSADPTLQLGGSAFLRFKF